MSPPPSVLVRVPQESAGFHLCRAVPTAGLERGARAVLHELVGARFDEADTVYVVDADQHLLGLVPIEALLAAAPEATLGSLMRADAPTAHLGMDQEEVLALALGAELTALPVVDDTGRFVGSVPAKSLLAIAHHEHSEDVHRMAGIVHRRAHHVVEDDGGPSLALRLRMRLPWLVVGLMGSGVATGVVAFFEESLRGHVAVAFFIPAIVYLADAIGTQTEAIVVRSLSLDRVSLGRLLARELSTGALMGLVLGAGAWLAVTVGFSDPRLGAAVGIAIAVAGGIASFSGAGLPWLFDALGFDPAFGSGPVATIVQDVLSLVVYFTTVQWLLL